MATRSLRLHVNGSNYVVTGIAKGTAYKDILCTIAKSKIEEGCPDSPLLGDEMRQNKIDGKRIRSPRISRRVSLSEGKRYENEQDNTEAILGDKIDVKSRRPSRRSRPNEDEMLEKSKHKTIDNPSDLMFATKSKESSSSSKEKSRVHTRGNDGLQKERSIRKKDRAKDDSDIETFRRSRKKLRNQFKQKAKEDSDAQAYQNWVKVVNTQRRKIVLQQKGLETKKKNRSSDDIQKISIYYFDENVDVSNAYLDEQRTLKSVRKSNDSSSQKRSSSEASSKLELHRRSKAKGQVGKDVADHNNREIGGCTEDKDSGIPSWESEECLPKESSKKSKAVKTMLNGFERELEGYLISRSTCSCPDLFSGKERMEKHMTKNTRTSISNQNIREHDEEEKSSQNADQFVVVVEDESCGDKISDDFRAGLSWRNSLGNSLDTKPYLKTRQSNVSCLEQDDQLDDDQPDDEEKDENKELQEITSDFEEIKTALAMSKDNFSRKAKVCSTKSKCGTGNNQRSKLVNTDLENMDDISEKSYGLVLQNFEFVNEDESFGQENISVRWSGDEEMKNSEQYFEKPVRLREKERSVSFENRGSFIVIDFDEFNFDLSAEDNDEAKIAGLTFDLNSNVEDELKISELNSRAHDEIKITQDDILMSRPRLEFISDILKDNINHYQEDEIASGLNQRENNEMENAQSVEETLSQNTSDIVTRNDNKDIKVFQSINETLSKNMDLCLEVQKIGQMSSGKSNDVIQEEGLAEENVLEETYSDLKDLLGLNETNSDCENETRDNRKQRKEESCEDKCKQESSCSVGLKNEILGRYKRIVYVDSLDIKESSLNEKQGARRKEDKIKRLQVENEGNEKEKLMIGRKDKLSNGELKKNVTFAKTHERITYVVSNKKHTRKKGNSNPEKVEVRTKNIDMKNGTISPIEEFKMDSKVPNGLRKEKNTSHQKNVDKDPNKANDSAHLRQVVTSNPKSAKGILNWFKKKETKGQKLTNRDFNNEDKIIGESLLKGSSNTSKVNFESRDSFRETLDRRNRISLQNQDENNNKKLRGRTIESEKIENTDHETIGNSEEKTRRHDKDNEMDVPELDDVKHLNTAINVASEEVEAFQEDSWDDTFESILKSSQSDETESSIESLREFETDDKRLERDGKEHEFRRSEIIAKICSGNETCEEIKNCVETNTIQESDESGNKKDNTIDFEEDNEKSGRLENELNDKLSQCNDASKDNVENSEINGERMSNLIEETDESKDHERKKILIRYKEFRDKIFEIAEKLLYFDLLVLQTNLELQELRTTELLYQDDVLEHDEKKIITDIKEFKKYLKIVTMTSRKCREEFDKNQREIETTTATLQKQKMALQNLEKIFLVKRFRNTPRKLLRKCDKDILYLLAKPSVTEDVVASVQCSV